jgi:hypothetical protein
MKLSASYNSQKSYPASNLHSASSSYEVFSSSYSYVRSQHNKVVSFHISFQKHQNSQHSLSMGNFYSFRSFSYAYSIAKSYMNTEPSNSPTISSDITHIPSMSPTTNGNKVPNGKIATYVNSFGFSDNRCSTYISDSIVPNQCMSSSSNGTSSYQYVCSEDSSLMYVQYYSVSGCANGYESGYVQYPSVGECIQIYNSSIVGSMLVTCFSNTSSAGNAMLTSLNLNILSRFENC